MFNTPKERHYSGQEMKDIQQPLDYKTGFSNPKFDELYPETPNPFHGTDRDIKNRKGDSMVSFSDIPQERWDSIFGKK